MLTVGGALAAMDERPALASIEWTPGRAVVRELAVGVDDARIVAAVRAADKSGLDCPLGWPEPFVALVSAHRAGHIADPAVAGTGAQWRRRLVYRLTDEVVRARTGLVPLSVSADRIAHAALRGAGLLAMLAADGVDVDRCGDGSVVEVYPAASLRCWGLTHRGYKRPGREVHHGALLDALLHKASWLDLGRYEPLCRTSHDATDALVAGLTARAAALGQATRPDPGQRAVARAEGWIALPVCDVGELV